MKVRYLAVFRNSPPGADALELCCEKYLEGLGYFTKPTVSEFLSWTSGVAAQRTQAGVMNIAEDKGHYVYAYGREEGICGVLVADNEYGERPALTLLRKICDEFLTKYTASVIKEAKGANSLPLPDLKEYIMKYQNPAEADAIMRIQDQLDQTPHSKHI